MYSNEHYLKSFAGFLGIVALVLVAILVDLKLGPKEFEVPYDRSKAKPLSSFTQNQNLGRAPASTRDVLPVSILIPAGQTAYIDKSMNVDSITINGELHCDEAQAGQIPITVRAKTIEVYGVLQCGTKFNPYNKKITFSLVHSNKDPNSDSGYRGLVVKNGGKLIMHGNRRNTAWRKLVTTAMPGDNFIEVQSDLRRVSRNKKVISNTRSTIGTTSSRRNTRVTFGPSTPPLSYQTNRWKVGDKIVIGPTGFDYQEAESFTITSVDSNQTRVKLGLNGTIQHMHWGQTQSFNSRSMGSVVLDERAEVANLTRNILIKADETNGPIDEGNGQTAQRGGHIMVHPGGEAYIDSIELYKMGQAGVMARYPFHWHWVGDASGQYIKNSAIHHSFQRCVTVHRTHKTLVQNNVCYNFRGHGYFLEDGNEIENKLIHNLAIMARAPHANKVLLQSDKAPGEGQGRFPSVSCFWISNPNNYIVGNVASGCLGSAIWMSFEKEVKDMNGNVVAQPLYEDTDVFNYNYAHSSKVGITWDGAPGWQNANNPNNPLDKVLTSAHYEPENIPTFIGNRAWKNYYSGIYFRGQTVVYKNSVLADNGWNIWVAYNQIFKDTVVIGRTNNTSQTMLDYYYANARTDRRRPTGIVLYDGPFEAHNIDFLNFSTQPETYTFSNGSSVESTAVPFTATGGSNKFINLVSGVNFSPEPAYRVHMEDSGVNTAARSFLGNGAIRDMDGSLSGTGTESVIVAIRSLGVRPQDNCVDGGTTLYNFQTCSASYTEGSQTFMRWGASAWSTPFVVMRDDGKLSYPIDEWNTVLYRSNNLFATVNDSNVIYHLLPRHQYEFDRLNNANTRMDATTESMNPVQPIVKLVAYGYNCRLKMGNGDPAYEASSLEDLKLQNQTSYYSDGEDFYVKSVPTVRWRPIEDDPVVQATAMATMTSDGRYPIECDEGYINKEVKGKIESVFYSANTTTVRGWACNYTHETSIQVKLYAYGPSIASPHNPTNSRQMATKSRNVSIPASTYTHIADANSNLLPDGELAFKCGRMSQKGRQFEFVIDNEDLDDFTTHRFAVKGISNSGGEDRFIERSNVYLVKSPKHLDPIDIKKPELELQY